MMKFNFITNFITIHSSNFLSAFFGDYLGTFFGNLGSIILNFIMGLIWTVIKLILTVMDALEYIAFSFLGLDISINDFSHIEERVDLTLVKTAFRALVVVAILLMLIFTIVSIIKQEFANVASGFTKTDKDGTMQETNPKLPMLKKIFSNILIIITAPIMGYMIFIGVTSMLNSFNKALKQTQSSTIAEQLLATSTYESNKYRIYANENQRIPIIINAYDDSDANYDNIDEIAVRISDISVQSSLKDIATRITNKTVDSFDKSLVRKNGRFSNSTNYSSMYESFICTPEQYQVMADFVDYAEASGVDYYIKSIDDSGIDWKYVDTSIYNQITGELTIKYRNANFVNSGNTVSAASFVDDEEFEITYVPVSATKSIISSALDMIKGIYGIGEYAGNSYNVMERHDDYTNLVTWASEKALLKFSDDFNLANKSTWTDTDEILVYEYYRWQYNNTFRDYTIDDIKKGIEADVYLISYRNYYSAIDLYSDEKYLNVVKINKNYYIVEKDETLFDKMGNAYYKLVSHSDENYAFLQKSYTTVKETDSNFNMKLSSSFNINDSDTSWSLQDQILIYEFFKDATYKNTLRQHNFDEYVNPGVQLPIYEVKNYDDDGKYTTDLAILLNDTLYKLTSDKSKISVSEDLLIKIENNNNYIYYCYKILDGKLSTIKSTYKLNIDKLDEYINECDVSKFEDLGNNSGEIKWENYKFKFSSNFDYADLSTWSFRDILLYYIYSLGYNMDITYLRKFGLKSEVGKVDGQIVLKFNSFENASGEDKIRYLKISEIEEISQDCIYQIKLDDTFENNLFSSNANEIFIYTNSGSKFVEDNISVMHFRFSDGFDAYDETTWTDADWILMYFCKLGENENNFEFDSIENLRFIGYDALLVDDDYVYFGKETSDVYRIKLSDINDGGILTIDETKVEKTDYPNLTNATEKIILKFSANFEPSNYSSWSQSDFILYYMLKKFGIEDESMTISDCFRNGVEVSRAKLINYDVYGNTEVTNAYKYGNFYINVEVFDALRTRKLDEYFVEDLGLFAYNIELFEPSEDSEYFMFGRVNADIGIGSIEFDNNYYYEFGNNYNELTNNLDSISNEFKQYIEKYDQDHFEVGSINLQLNGNSETFLNNFENWNVLNYIVLKEFSRDIKNNEFAGMSFDDLFKYKNITNLYINVDKGYFVVEVNGNYYNLNGFIELNDPSTDEYKPKNTETMNGRLNVGTPGSYDFVVKKGIWNFDVNPKIKYSIPMDSYTVAFKNIDNLTYYITPHEGTKVGYQVQTSLYDYYEISLCERKVSWPQKLMNDMMILYPDLNWNTLIANGNWIDVLGDYVSANTNGIFKTEGNSSNITAVGMILSEFFLSKATQSNAGYANYEYQSLFDKNIIDSLMKSSVDEDEYEQLCLQAKIFVEIFNTTFATMIDDIYEENASDPENDESVDISTFVYKAFLATQILSSDFGEYLYTVANRVYAQYTIYESLASATGKYAEYQDYIDGNGQKYILKIDNNYFDVSTVIEEISPKQRLALNEMTQTISEISDTDTIQKIKAITHTFVTKINNSSDYDDDKEIHNVFDAIIVNELAKINENSQNNVVIRNRNNLKSTDNGVDVTIYTNSDEDIYLEINNRYYDIEQYVTYKGDYEITEKFGDYLKKNKTISGSVESFKEFLRNLKNVLVGENKNFTFIPSSYVLNLAQNATTVDSYIKVGYSTRFKELDEGSNWLDIFIGFVNNLTSISDETFNESFSVLDYILQNEVKITDKEYSQMCEIIVVDSQNAFTYSTFEQLVKYENIALNDYSTPIFTFNMKRAYKTIVYDNKNIEVPAEFYEESGEKSWTYLTSDEKWHETYSYLLDELRKYYSKKYSNKEKIYDNDPLYCYMLEVYYSIYNDCKNQGILDTPIYLNVYEDFISGNVGRWNILKQVGIDATTQYIPNYYVNKLSLNISLVRTTINWIKLYVKNVDFNGDIIEAAKNQESEDDYDSLFGKLSSYIKGIKDELDDELEVYSVLSICNKSGISTAMPEDYNNVFRVFDPESGMGMIETLLSGLDILGIGKATCQEAKLLGLFLGSASGNENSWAEIVKIRNSLGKILNELIEIKDLFLLKPENYKDAMTANGSKIAHKLLADDYYDEETYENIISIVQDAYESFNEYIRLQEILDATVKSCITFTLAQYGKNYVTSYRFNLEHRGYTLSSITSSPLRLAEYTLGGSFLVDFGVYPTFTSEDFDGFIHKSKTYSSEYGLMQTKLDMWPELKKFASKIAEYTSKLYFTSQFNNVASEAKDGIYLSDKLKASDGINLITIEKMILEYIFSGDDDDNLSLKTLKNILGDDNVRIITKEQLLQTYATDEDKYHEIFISVMEYLLSEKAKENEYDSGVELSNITLKDLKLLIMDSMIHFGDNLSNNKDESVSKYLTLFNLLCFDITFYVNEEVIGTIINPSDLYNPEHYSSRISPYSATPSDCLKLKQIADDGSISGGADIQATYDINEAAQSIVLSMTAVENNALEDIVYSDYEKLYKQVDGYYDENDGDIFVVCLYDFETCKFIPFMAQNSYTQALGEGYKEYINDYHHLIYTDYYANDGRAYPIIAKGIITADGLPTAIRIEDGKVKYYRTNITATTEIGESAITNSMYSTEITTVNYVKYVPTTFYVPFQDTNKAVKFIGDYNMSTILKSDIKAYFLQTDVVYVLDPLNDMGAYNVIDYISSHYTLSGQTIILMYFGFIILIPMMFKLSLNAMRRILDLILLYLELPMILAIGTIKEKSPYEDWKNNVIKAFFNVFGYVIGFNVYFMLASTILKMNFVSQVTVDNIRRLSGFNIISLTSINMIIRYIFLLEAISLINGAMKLILPIMTGGKVTDALVSAVDGKDTFEQIKNIKKDTIASLKKLQGIVNGQALIELKDAAISSALSMIPGSEIMQSVADDAKSIVDRTKAKMLEKKLTSHGISPELAKKFKQSYIKNAKDKRQNKRQKRLDNANKFMSTYASDFKFSEFKQPQHLGPVIKENFLPFLHKDEDGKKKTKKGKTKKK